MKKFALVLCAMLVVFGSMAVVAHAAPSYNQMWNEYCKWLADVDPDWFDYIYKNHGDCVSDYTARYPNSDAAKFWQEMWDDPWFQMYYSWKNQGDCVSYWQKYFK